MFSVYSHHHGLAYAVTLSLTLVDLQINAVSPVMQLKPHFEDKPISEQILKWVDFPTLWEKIGFMLCDAWTC